jgi:hypothetical protein
LTRRGAEGVPIGAQESTPFEELGEPALGLERNSPRLGILAPCGDVIDRRARDGGGAQRPVRQVAFFQDALTGAALKILNEDYRNQILASVRSTRLGVPDDIAAMVAFLFSDAAYVNGQTILVYGGANLT